MHLIVFYAAAVWLVALLGATVFLLIRARSVMIRILAFDTMALMLVGLLVLFAHRNLSVYYLDAALVLALLSFVGTLADGLVITGVLVMAIAIYGMSWLPDVYNQLHASSKAVVLGVVPLLLAACTTGQPGIIYRSILIGIFLLLTTSVASHAIAQAAYHQGEGLVTPQSIDETGRLTPPGPDPHSAASDSESSQE